MKCSKCGVENKEGALFCKGCGNDLSKDKVKSENNKSEILRDMDVSLAETSKMIDVLYKKFEIVKKNITRNQM